MWDNIGAIYLYANSVFHYRTKHVDVDVHFVWNLAMIKRHLDVQYLSTTDKPADIYTNHSAPNSSSIILYSKSSLLKLILTIAIDFDPELYTFSITNPHYPSTPTCNPSTSTHFSLVSFQPLNVPSQVLYTPTLYILPFRFHPTSLPLFLYHSLLD